MMLDDDGGGGGGGDGDDDSIDDDSLAAREPKHACTHVIVYLHRWICSIYMSAYMYV